jgi:diguanylate cyclase
MLSVNHQLEADLQASRVDMEALQADLESIRHQSVLDPLTMIHNRKYLDEALRDAVQRAQARSAALSLMMIDIDNFKNFNDTWGHQTGDQVLRLVAMTIKKQLRGSDTLARFGGEEFVVILPETDLRDGLVLAESARVSLDAKELLRRSTDERLGKITASFGVASFVPGDTPVSLIERADMCLYAAKEAGRNCVVSDQSLVPERNRLEEPLAL